MEKLHKIGTWVWLNKEKVVLVVLILVFCYRVYKVVDPEEAAPLDIPKAPKALPSGPEAPPPGADFPGDPPLPPAPPIAVPASRFAESNPFTIYGTTEHDEDQGPRRPEMRLVGIRPFPDGKPRAEIITRGTKPKRYKEGEAFETYRLESIDEASGSIVIYSQEHNRTFTYQLEGAS
ncbi:MAG: hypothetical protein JXR94_22395 [Candidatus Hydrogenedentes bacterium]|nr:hypothetical protein [Candidatus Hydrogenedentota bacterium]